MFVALLACCGEAPDVTEFDPAFAVELSTIRPAPLEVGHCGMAFDPVSEMLELTKAAAARWSSATGCDVRVEPGGVPVRAQGFLFIEELPSGLVRVHDSNPQLAFDELCGGTFWRPDGSVSHIIVATDSPSCPRGPGVSTDHEAGHALARRRGHPATGLMADTNADGRTDVVNSASLVWICEALDCAVFVPEE
jgi:hypothetical protein